MYTLLNPQNGLFCSYEPTVYELLLLVAERSAPVILLAFLRLCHSFLASGPIVCFKSLFLCLSLLLLPASPSSSSTMFSVPWTSVRVVIWPQAQRGTALAACNLNPALHRICFPFSTGRLQQLFPPTHFSTPLCSGPPRPHSQVCYPLHCTDLFSSTRSHSHYSLPRVSKKWRESLGRMSEHKRLQKTWKVIKMRPFTHLFLTYCYFVFCSVYLFWPKRQVTWTLCNEELALQYHCDFPAYFPTVKLEATDSSETSVLINETTKQRIPEEECNHLKPSGYHMHHETWHYRTLRSARALHLCVLYGSQNRNYFSMVH
jgi:hypothetical protein